MTTDIPGAQPKKLFGGKGKKYGNFIDHLDHMDSIKKLDYQSRNA